MNGIAFFDIDHTIVDGSTGLFVLLQMWREKKVSVRDLQKAIYYTFLYRIGRLRYEQSIKWIYQVCGKISIDELVRITDIAYEKHILPNIFSEAIDTIEDYRGKGFLVCLATATSDYVAYKIQAQVSADLVISNTSTVRNNRLTDGLSNPICYGIGKKAAAYQLAQEKAVSLSECAFYSDSRTDLPLLEAVGEPVIVNPRRIDGWYRRLNNYSVVRWKKRARNLEPVCIERPWSNQPLTR